MANILFIGGSGFAGYFAVGHALTRGHQVAMFNRGKTNPDAYPTIEHITGNRDQDIELLRGRDWDAVIDMCGFVPRVVRKSAELLRDHVKQYLFISSISAYAEQSIPATESSPLASLDNPDTGEITGETYGGLKALCEKVVQDSFPDGSVIIRPGLIVGPRDPSYRFDYWIDRVARGGEILAPESAFPVQFIDARDLGEWLIHLVETHATSIYNAVNSPVSMRQLLETTKSVIGGDAHFTWIDESFLLDHEVAPWQELPLWLPESHPLNTSANNRAVGAGLIFRPLENTIHATWDYLRDHPDKATLDTATLRADKEIALLREWRNK